MKHILNNLIRHARYFAKKTSRHLSTLQKFEIVAVLVAIFLFIIGLVLFWGASLTLPKLSSFDDRKVSESTKIYDKTGEILLYDVYQDVRRKVVPFDQIAQNIKNATIAIEDVNFYQHNGIEIKSIIRAVFANLFSLGYSQGGSTITQQVVKNSILTQDKTITRKLKEWILAVKLDAAMSKDDILSLYLNEVPYGGSIYGVEEASKNFFNKSAKDVTLAEAAYLAALPQAPTYFSPYGTHKKELSDRKNLVLLKMRENDLITEEEYQNALKEVVEFQPKANTGIKAPHFVMFIKDYLENKYGENMVTEGGLKVITTLDYDLQQKGEEIAKKYALENKKNFNAENASFVAIDPKTGGILAMVGSRDYFDKEIDGNFNIATAERQPGSSFKPFVYAAAFNKGLRPETVVFDLKTQFSTACAADNLTSDGDCYSPVNYDGKFRGPISLREALAQSLNIPAIKVFYLAGLQNALNLAKDMGISTLEKNTDRYGLTLVLGGGEVSLLDMTSGYSVFANEGARNPYTGIISVTDKTGRELEKMSVQSKNVLPVNTARQISSILSDDAARTPEFGARSALYFEGRDVAAKTGTTNDYRDAWIIGYTPSIAIGAWAGNNDNTPMEKKIAGFIVAPMWHEFMQYALTRVPVESFIAPEVNTSDAPPVIRGLWQGNKSYSIDTVSGKLATELTPIESQKEYVIRDIHSILYWIDKDNPIQNRTDSPTNDPQFRLWEYPVQQWVAQQGLYPETNVIIPTAEDNVHTPEKMPRMNISLLTDADSFSKDDTVTVQVNGTFYYPITKGEVYLNDRYIGSISLSTKRFSFSLANIDSLQTFNDIRVTVTDSVMNKVEDKIRFTVNQ